MSTHSYASEYPKGVLVRDGIREFLEGFYRLSDVGGMHEEYVDQFAENAELVMGVKRSKGKEEILAFRKSMWEKVASRLHTVHKVFPFGEDSKEVMLFGTVDYVFKDGGKGQVSIILSRKDTGVLIYEWVEWAGRAEFIQEGGKLKLAFYQVYLDSAAAQNVK